MIEIPYGGDAGIAAIQNPLVHFRADVNTPGAGSLIAGLTDLSGNGFHATQATGANQPTINTLIFPGGKPCITFGSSTHLDYTSAISIPPMFSIGGTYTVFWVANPLAGGRYGAPISFRRSAAYTGPILDTAVAGVSCYIYGDGAHGPQNTTINYTISTNQANKMITKFSNTGNAPTITINGTLYTTTAGVQGNETGSNGFFVGNNAAGQYCTALAEVLVIARASTALEDAIFNKYVHDYYGINP